MEAKHAELEFKIDLAVAVLKQVASCPHCRNCKNLAEQYLSHLGDDKVKVSVEIETGKKAQ